jgi:hypothetical protein
MIRRMQYPAVVNILTVPFGLHGRFLVPSCPS